MLFFPGCALGLTMKDAHSFNNSPFLSHFFENCFTFWLCYEVGSKWFFKKLLFLICSFAFCLSVFLSTNVNLLPLPCVLRRNSLYVLFVLSFHLFSACFSALLILLLYFFRKVALNISCFVLDKNISTSRIYILGQPYYFDFSLLVVLFHR